MVDRCPDVLRRLEQDGPESVADHLDGCSGCRTAATELSQVTSWLAREAELAPPPALDRRLRSLLSGEPFGVLRRPWLAGGVAAASFVALLSALAVGLASTPAAEYGPLLAVLLGMAYLALSAAATLPLLLHARTHRGCGTEGRV